MPATIVKDEEDEPLPKKGKFRPAEVVRGGMTFGVVLVESTWSADQPHGLRPFPGGGRKQSKSCCHCAHLPLEHATERVVVVAASSLRVHFTFHDGESVLFFADDRN